MRVSVKSSGSCSGGSESVSESSSIRACWDMMSLEEAGWADGGGDGGRCCLAESEWLDV